MLRCYDSAKEAPLPSLRRLQQWPSRRCMKGSQEVSFAQTESKTKMWCKDYQRCKKHELQTFLHHPTPQPQANLRILVVSHGLHRRWQATQATLWFEKSSDPCPVVLSKSVNCIQTLQCPLQIYTNLIKSIQISKLCRAVWSIFQHPYAAVHLSSLTMARARLAGSSDLKMPLPTSDAVVPVVDFQKPPSFQNAFHLLDSPWSFFCIQAEKSGKLLGKKFRKQRLQLLRKRSLIAEASSKTPSTPSCMP